MSGQLYGNQPDENNNPNKVSGLSGKLLRKEGKSANASKIRKDIKILVDRIRKRKFI